MIDMTLNATSVPHPATPPMTKDRTVSHPQPHQPMHLSVQILSTLLFGGFAITSVVLAFVQFWPAGLVLAAFLGWRGGFVPGAFTQTHVDQIVEQVRSRSPAAPDDRHPNASFEAYRSNLLQRLEDEQHSFDDFLDRLRAAKDQSEFDQFLDERARRAIAAPATDPDPAPDRQG